MLPYIPQDMPHPQLQALVILRNGVPPRIRRFVMEPTIERTVGDMMDDWVEDIDDAEVDPEEILFHDGDWDVDSDAESDVLVITLKIIV